MYNRFIYWIIMFKCVAYINFVDIDIYLAYSQNFSLCTQCIHNLSRQICQLSLKSRTHWSIFLFQSMSKQCIDILVYHNLVCIICMSNYKWKHNYYTNLYLSITRVFLVVNRKFYKSYQKAGTYYKDGTYQKVAFIWTW